MGLKHFLAKEINEFHENSKISIIFLIPCISKQHLRNGMSLNVTNIHKPKLIKICNLCPKCHFKVHCGLSQKFKFASEHPV